MLYIAENGAFIPQAGDANTAATGQSPGTTAIHKFSVALVCLIWMVLIARRFSSVLFLARRMKITLAFPLLAILSCVWSADPLQSIVSGMILLIFTVFAIYVASRLSFQRQFELIMLIGAIALPASIALALLVPSMGATEAGWRGIFGHKQNCAAVSTFWLITAVHWKCSGLYQKFFRSINIVMCAVLIVMSQSRTGWALVLVALLLSAAIWILPRMPATQALAMLLLGLAATAGAAYAIHVYSPSILSSVGKDSTLSERTIIWSAAWQAALRHPILGYGFSAFWKGLYGPSQSVVLVAGWGLQQAQDGFLDVWLGIGVVGLALIALMTGQAMRNTIRCLYPKAQANEAYVRWCAVIILCTLLYNIGESSIGLLNMTWFLFLLASIGLNQIAVKTEGEVSYSSRLIGSSGHFSHPGSH
jgi:O-antigen ligase